MLSYGRVKHRDLHAVTTWFRYGLSSNQRFARSWLVLLASGLAEAQKKETETYRRQGPFYSPHPTACHVGTPMIAPLTTVRPSYRNPLSV